MASKVKDKKEKERTPQEILDDVLRICISKMSVDRDYGDRAEIAVADALLDVVIATGASKEKIEEIAKPFRKKNKQ